MNGFLVLFCGSMDDIPVGLYETREDALVRAANVTCEEAWGIAREVFGRDTSTATCVLVVEVKGGVPAASECVRNLEVEGE